MLLACLAFFLGRLIILIGELRVGSLPFYSFLISHLKSYTLNLMGVDFHVILGDTYYDLTSNLGLVLFFLSTLGLTAFHLTLFVFLILNVGPLTLAYFIDFWTTKA